MSKELILLDKGKPISIKELLDKLNKYFDYKSLDGKPERQKLHAEIKEILKTATVLDIEKIEPF